MPYFTITDFAAGLDLRKSPLTAPPGTLRVLKNCHITPGGEIEKRFAFVKMATVDPASKGLVEVNGNLYVFGPGGPGQTDPTGPWTIGTLQLAASAIERVIDFDLFDNKVFAIAETDTAGTVQRFYDGTEVPGANGLYCRTYKTKMFAVQGSVLFFSAVGDPSDWTGTGSGAIDLSLEDSDMTDCVALEVYYDWLAIFSKTACQLWTIDPDPLKTQYKQTLRQAGTVAPQSVLSYASGDVLYIAPDGIRSLRARNSSLAASVSDVGSPLDPEMQRLFRTMGEGFFSGAISILQPVTGRFWIIMPDRIYVLSAFPGPKITAWSEYKPVDADGNPFVVTAAAMHRQHVILRDDQNNVYAYGGASDTGVTYDNCLAEVVFPFLGGEKIATQKTYHGIDAAAQGAWDVYVAYDPENDAAEDYVGKIIGPTFKQGRQAMEGRSTHLSLRLRSTDAAPLMLSNLVVHYDFAEAS
jgi:hypothetical protein